MAIVNLAATYGLIGTAAEHGRWEESPEAVNDYWERRRELTERAFALSPRLPGRERFYIEGQHYRMQGEDARAIEAYEKAIDLHPDHLLARLSLASRYVTHHQFQDAIEQLEAIRSRTGAFRVGSTRADFLERPLAESYASLGRIDESFRILEEFVERFPEDPRGHEALGEHLVMTGRLDEALAGFERAQRLRDDGSVPTGMVIVHVVREEWAQAEVAARDNLFYRAVTRLYRGRSGEAVQLLTSLAEYERRDYLSETLLQLDRPSEILEFEGEPVLRAIALARLGRIEEAESEAKPFQGAQTPLARLYQHLFLFDLAKSRGDPVKGSEELGQAERLLAPRGRFRDEHPMHVPVWYRLACTHLEAGQLADAEEWFQKIVDSTTERVVWPIPYVRSLYLLGQIHEKRGELAAASRFYRRFYERWKDGDLDRDWVAHARTRSGI
jgi:tetratricopeptide (TPR) repeat protein